MKAIDLTLTYCKNAYDYLDDIVTVTKGYQEIHRDTLKIVLQKPNEKSSDISLDKQKFACKQAKWQGYTLGNEGTKPLIRKTEALEEFTLPKTFNRLKSFNTPSYCVKSKSSSAQTNAAMRHSQHHR